MKVIFKLLILFCIMSLPVAAQDKKPYTLEDVIPGGNNYSSLSPKGMSGLQWWGDVCIQAETETISSIQLKNGKKKTLVSLDEVNNALKDYTQKESDLNTLTGCSLPWADKQVVMFRHDGQVFCYDFSTKKITSAYLFLLT